MTNKINFHENIIVTGGAQGIGKIISVKFYY